MYKWSLFLIWLPLTGGCWILSEEEITGNADADGDGYTRAVDCNDDEPEVHPNADEICDGWDNDCDGFWDDVEDCDDDGFTADDCDPWDAASYPDAPELHDGLDNDCDGEIGSEECDSGLDCARDSALPPFLVGDPGCRCNQAGPSNFVWLVAAGLMGLRRGRRFHLNTLEAA